MDDSSPSAPARLRPGLTLVATPIGTAGDVTLRALGALREADAIFAEDTRQTRKLMEIHGIPLNDRPLRRCDAHREAEAAAEVLQRLQRGERVIFASDAGTPGVSDPGARLAAAVLAGGGTLSALPGPCAAIVALTVSGLPTDRFFFAGFPPAKATDRARFLEGLKAIPATLIFYEAPHRVTESLAAMALAFGGRPAAAARELTKLHEEIRRGTLYELMAHYDAHEPRGEFVIVVGPPEPEEPNAEDEAARLDQALETALAEGESLRDAAASVGEALGLSRKRVYARALELKEHSKR